MRRSKRPDSKGSNPYGRRADESEFASDPATIRNTAVGLLARREHSRAELKDKLRARGYDVEESDLVLDELARKKLLSDERYVASYIDHHARRGQGPARIRLALKQAGVTGEVIELAIDSARVDWHEAARTVRRKKFGAVAPQSFPERAKQARFLQYRGFSADQIRAALGSDAELADTDSDGF